MMPRLHHLASLVVVTCLTVSAAATTGSAAPTSATGPLIAAGDDDTNGETGGDGETYELVLGEPADQQPAEAVAAALGATVTGRAPGVVQVQVPAAAAAPLEGVMPLLGVTAREAVDVDVRPDGLPPDAPEQFGAVTSGADALTNALAWHGAGITGAGVKIGVIDYFDVTAYWNTGEHGPRPIAGVTAKCLDRGGDCTNEFFDGVDLGGEDHGVAVVESLLDMAPGAQIYLGQAGTISDYQALVDWFAANGVQIVSRSLGSRYDGPGDGRGPLNDIAAYANSRGILWVNSGGNNGAGKYYRRAVRTVADRVAFGPTGSDTFLAFEGCANLGGVRWSNDWDLPAAQRTDYDVFLWEAPSGLDPASGSIVDSSTLRQRLGASPIESIDDLHCPSSGHTLYLEMRLVAGSPVGDVIEVLNYGSAIEYGQTAYSASTPIVDSDLRGVLAVGALSSVPPREIASYSSQGPTNDGRIAPDISVLGSYPSTLSGGTFTGTSAAAPVVAGGAALMIQAGLATNTNPLGDLLRHLVVDRGAPGPDSVYGHGEFRLPDPPAAPLSATPSVFNPLDVPLRVLDSRPSKAIGPAELIGDAWSGQILDLPIVDVAGLPPGAVTAVAVNITSTGSGGTGYLQALPTLQAEVGGSSTLNIDATGQVRANFAIVPVGVDGSISIVVHAGGNVVVDLVGWFSEAPAAQSSGRFVALEDAQRVMDSREIAPIAPLRSGEVRRVPLPSGIDPDLIGALVVTVTATQATGRGWVQILPGGADAALGKTSTLNVTPGDTVANAAIVSVSDQGVVVTGSFSGAGTAAVVVDVTGYMTSSAAADGLAGRFVPVTPTRAFDSRQAGARLLDGQRVTVDTRATGVPGSAAAVMWNITATQATRKGRAAGWAADRGFPPTSLLNWPGANSKRAAGAVVGVANGRASFQVNAGLSQPGTPLTHLITDVFGYFT